MRSEGAPTERNMIHVMNTEGGWQQFSSHQDRFESVLHTAELGKLENKLMQQKLTGHDVF